MTVDVRELTLLTVQETAALLKQSERSIRRKIYREHLPAIRLGDAAPLRVPAGELRAWLEKHRASTSPSDSTSGVDPAERRAPGSAPAVEARAHAGGEQ
jgi:excisionase family DNA binding protein